VPTTLFPRSEGAAGFATLAGAAHPPFYRVSGGEGADLFLLGTIHFGPRDGWRFTPVILEAAARAEALVLEIDLATTDPASIERDVWEHGLQPPGETLAAQVHPETEALLEARKATLDRLGFDAETRSRMRPWLLALGLLQSGLAQSGFSTEAAADHAIAAAMADRPVIALESAREQILLLAELSPVLQDLALRDALLRLDDHAELVHALARAWWAGDEPRLAALTREGVDGLPQLAAFYEQLLDERNERWLAPLVGLLQDPERRDGEIVVAVGTAHLIGSRSLPALLREADFRVERIE